MPDTTATPTGLAPAALAVRCDPAALPFATTAELKSAAGLVGQERAVDAIQLAATIEQPGFNLFVVGPEGTGRHDAARRVLAERARQRPVPPDWIYVNNFDTAHKPIAIAVPPGMGPILARAVEAMIDDLATDIPALFESEEYQTRRRAIEEEYSDKQEAALAAFAERISREDVAMVRTPMGYMLTATRDGKPLDQDAFSQLDPAEREAIDAKISRFQEDLAEVMRQAPRIDRERRHAVEAINAEMAEHLVSERVAALDRAFFAVPPVAAHLDAVRADIIANADVFIKVAANKDDGPFPEVVGQMHLHPAFGRYRVNVLITRDPAAARGAPVETEDLPTLDRLTGRIDHVSQMGSLVTNFTMIRPGALHRANGGYLMLDARRVLSEPYAWDALKRSLKSGSLTITSLAERLSLLSTTSLEPDPIPLDVRVVLVGDRLLHALLVLLDPDFSELFKVQADFDDRVARSDENLALYARLIGSFAEREKMRAFEAGAVARLLDEATRLSEDTQKISLRLGALAELMREAEHYAAARGADAVAAQDVARAVAEKERRGARVRERMQEAVARGTVLIDTDGAKVGQVNGLSVIGIANDRFGHPSRITARVRMGAGKLVDIEREVELGGPIHSKGVMILGGYLTANYAREVPFSLYASIVFEQSYGGVEGDSASSAELYALLSALSELPLDQGLAVTGSVNQLGEVQAIGGVNEKIEGFFDACAARGLTGRQGVLIPAANVEHLMLRERVVEAAQAGKFRILPVRTIDEGIALLTGRAAGTRGDDGRYPDGSVNALVEARLEHFAEGRRAFMRRADGPNGEAAGG